MNTVSLTCLENDYPKVLSQCPCPLTSELRRNYKGRIYSELLYLGLKVVIPRLLTFGTADRPSLSLLLHREYNRILKCEIFSDNSSQIMK